MSKAAWAAIITAIAMPSIALVIVVSVNSRGRAPVRDDRPTPPAMTPGTRPARQPGMGMMQGPPTGDRPEDMLRRLDERLDLTDEQVEKILAIVKPSHERRLALHDQIGKDEAELRTLLESGKVDEEKVEALIDSISGHRGEIMKLSILTPLRIDRELTDEQLAKLQETRMQGGPGQGPQAGKPVAGPPPRAKKGSPMRPPGKGQPPQPPPPGAAPFPHSKMGPPVPPPGMGHPPHPPPPGAGPAPGDFLKGQKAPPPGSQPPPPTPQPADG